MNRIEEARKVFDIEIDAIKKTEQSIGSVFSKICDEILQCVGKVIWVGMGKPGHIGRKLSATFSSLGTPSFFLHPAEAQHGDLGMISKNDVVIMVSYSGESDEIIRLIPNIKLIGAKIIALTGNGESTLAKNSDLVEVFPKFNEACYMGLAPTSSTTVELVYGDALAVVVAKEKGFEKFDFGKFHPAGALGKQLLLHVSDVMLSPEETAIVDSDSTLKDAIVEMSKKGLSIVVAVKEGKVFGILTDGDLRRILERNVEIYDKSFRDVMTVNPTTISDQALAIDALKLLRDKRFSSLPVVDETNNYIGVVTMHSIINAGIVLMKDNEEE